MDGTRKFCKPSACVDSGSGKFPKGTDFWLAASQMQLMMWVFRKKMFPDALAECVVCTNGEENSQHRRSGIDRISQGGRHW